MIFLAFPPLHVKYIMQFLLGVLEVVVKVLHEILLEIVDAVLNVARHLGSEELVPAEIENVRVGRLDRLFPREDSSLRARVEGMRLSTLTVRADLGEGLGMNDLALWG